MIYRDGRAQQSPEYRRQLQIEALEASGKRAIKIPDNLMDTNEIPEFFAIVKEDPSILKDEKRLRKIVFYSDKLGDSILEFESIGYPNGPEYPSFRWLIPGTMMGIGGNYYPKPPRVIFHPMYKTMPLFQQKKGK